MENQQLSKARIHSAGKLLFVCGRSQLGEEDSYCWGQKRGALGREWALQGEFPRDQDNKAVIRSGEGWTDSTLSVERPEC